MPEIKFNNVTAYIQNKKDKTVALILEDFSVTFKNNKLTCIVGESGSGKTTLLKCIIDTISYNGEIYFDDVNVDTMDMKSKKIGYICQTSDLAPNKTVFDNILFPLTIQKMKEEKARELIYKFADEFEITFLLARKVKELSSGQKKIVSFIKTIIKEPNIVLLDEPTSDLDKETSEYVLNKLVNYIKIHQSTCIMVTHNLDVALKYGDEIMVMDEGKIIKTGTPKEIFSSNIPEVQRLFHAEEVA